MLTRERRKFKIEAYHNGIAIGNIMHRHIFIFLLPSKENHCMCFSSKLKSSLGFQQVQTNKK